MLMRVIRRRRGVRRHNEERRATSGARSTSSAEPTHDHHMGISQMPEVTVTARPKRPLAFSAGGHTPADVDTCSLRLVHDHVVLSLEDSGSARRRGRAFVEGGRLRFDGELRPHRRRRAVGLPPGMAACS